MNNLVELLLGLLLILLILGQPVQLQELTHTTLGKTLFLVVAVCGTVRSLWTGLLLALIYITLHNGLSLVETMDNKDHDEEEDEDEEKNCDCDDKECEVTDGKERMTVDEALRPQESNSIPV
ncbi:MAG: hypothetical protein ACR2M6_03230 [Vampirovibrionia bacterium]|jgi:hypothetical protein